MKMTMKMTMRMRNGAQGRAGQAGRVFRNGSVQPRGRRGGETQRRRGEVHCGAMALLRCGPLSARDGEGRVLFHDAVFELEGGALTLLEGPSGGGKSTLLRQVAGLAPAAAGAGRRLAGEEWPAAATPAWRARVTLLAQDAPMLPGTVEENLRFPFRLFEAGSRRWDPARVRALLSAVDLEGIGFDRPAARLSGGERHRLALVRGLLWDPPVLLADEPLSGLDQERARGCFRLLAEHARRSGRAVLCVLHDAAEGSSWDRRLRLEAGRLENV